MIAPTIMRSPTRVMVAVVLVLQLAACGGGSGDDDERTASGEVLEGSITDEMLPLDQVTSQPPLLKIEPTSKPSEGADAVEEDTDDAEAPGDAPPIATQTGSTE